jgi:hypothetical protein
VTYYHCQFLFFYYDDRDGGGGLLGEKIPSNHDGSGGLSGDVSDCCCIDGGECVNLLSELSLYCHCFDPVPFILIFNLRILLSSKVILK